MGLNSTRSPVWKRPEIISLVLAGAVVLTTSLSSWWSFDAFRRSREGVRRSRSIALQVQEILATTLAAESGQRGFLLTGRESYLRPYREASSQIASELSKIRILSQGNAHEQSDAAKLFALVTDKMAELRETIQTAASQGNSAALRIVETGHGQDVMDRIHALSGHMVGEQFENLNDRSRQAEASSNRSLIINIAGDLILLALLSLAVAAVRRATERREELIQTLIDDQQHMRQLRGAAEAAEERNRLILESITDAFISLDGNWRIAYVNPEAYRLLGREKDTLKGRELWAEFPDLKGSEVEKQYCASVENQTPLSFETFLDSRNAWWEQNVYPAQDGGLSVFFRDVTARRHFEERTRHTQKLESLGVLAGGIAHDFNNLLTAILGSASLVLEEVAANSRSARLIGNVVKASERAAQLTRQMLAYSGRGRFVVELVDLAGQIREFAALLESSVPRNIELILNLSTDGILIEADPSQIQQLVMNLVINGAEAIGEATGSVIVSSRREELDVDYVRDNLAGDDIAPGSYILLEIHDTGKGMDGPTLARIFDPFFTTKFTGRGLGLAAVLGIVRGHRGALKVYSHVGQGTTFKVFLPVAQEQVLPEKKAPQEMDYHGTGTVLVVDDEDVVQRMAQSTLERFGYRVLLASNGREAVDIFQVRHQDVDLVLLDMTMPVMSGEETLTCLKEIDPAVRVIASSGYNEVEALRRFGRGINGFLQKPYRAAQLAQKVKTNLESSAVN